MPLVEVAIGQGGDETGIGRIIAVGIVAAPGVEQVQAGCELGRQLIHQAPFGDALFVEARAGPALANQGRPRRGQVLETAEVEVGCVALQAAVLAAIEQAPAPQAVSVIRARRAAGKEGQAARPGGPLSQAQAQAVDFLVDDVAIEEVVIETACFDFQPGLFVLHVEPSEV